MSDTPGFTCMQGTTMSMSAPALSTMAPASQTWLMAPWEDLFMLFLGTPALPYHISPIMVTYP